MNTAEIVREFSRKYAGTFFFTAASKESEQTLIRCDHIETERGGKPVMSCEGYGVGKLTFKIPSEQVFSFKMPPCGVWQFGPSAYEVSRLPHRQWQRGICSKNTGVAHTLGKVFSSLAGQLSLDSVHAFFRQQTFTFREALTMLASKKYVSVALGNGFSLGQTSQEKGYLLCYGTDVIATVSAGGIIERLFSDAFLKQVNQLVGE